MSDRFKFRAFYKNKMIWLNYFIQTSQHTTISADRGAYYNALIPNEEINLMQCTGLKDKNGKLIYEGDILEHKFGRPLTISKNVVYWDRKHWMTGKPVYTKCCHKKIEKYFSPCGASTFKEFYESKIIGNIHQNPELLEA